MFNVENRYSKQSDLQNAKTNVCRHKIKAKHSNEKQETLLGHETSFKMNIIYSLSKTLSKQKIVFFWGNLDHSGKSLHSNAFNRDIKPSKQIL